MKHLLIERIVMLLDFYGLKGEFIELYPKRNSMLKWLLLTEEIHRFHNSR